MSILEKVLRAGEGRMVRRLKAIAEAVNAIEDDYVDLTDDELRGLTQQYQERYADGESLDSLLPEAFATAREAARRVLGQRAFDVQLMGGAALHFGNIPEMKTGEGKTLTGVFPAYLNALSGKGVHIITVNDYLAQRDAEWVGSVHVFLGLTVGVILPNRPAAEHARRPNGLETPRDCAVSELPAIFPPLCEVSGRLGSRVPGRDAYDGSADCLGER